MTFRKIDDQTKGRTTMHTTTRRCALLAVVAATTLTAAACSQDDAAAPATPPPATTTMTTTSSEAPTTTEEDPDAGLEGEAAANADENFQGPVSMASRTEHDGLSSRITGIELDTTADFESGPNVFITLEFTNLGDETIPLPTDGVSSITDLTYGENLTDAQGWFGDNDIDSAQPGQLVPGSSFTATEEHSVPVDQADDLQMYINLDSNQYAGWIFLDVQNAGGEVAPNDLPPFEPQGFDESQDFPGDPGALSIEDEWELTEVSDRLAVCELWTTGDQSVVLGLLSEFDTDELTTFLDDTCVA